MNDTTLKPALAMRREIPHTVSPGLWTLAWRRLKTDSVAMVSLAIVVAFIAMMLLSALGVVASDWAREVGVNYAPPTFVGADEAPPAAVPGTESNVDAPAVPSGPTPGASFNSTVVDPIGKELAELKGGAQSAPGRQPRRPRPRAASSTRSPTS